MAHNYRCTGKELRSTITLMRCLKSMACKAEGRGGARRGDVGLGRGRNWRKAGEMGRMRGKDGKVSEESRRGKGRMQSKRAGGASRAEGADLSVSGVFLLLLLLPPLLSRFSRV